MKITARFMVLTLVGALGTLCLSSAHAERLSGYYCGGGATCPSSPECQYDPTRAYYLSSLGNTVYNCFITDPWDSSQSCGPKPTQCAILYVWPREVGCDWGKEFTWYPWPGNNNDCD